MTNYEKKLLEFCQRKEKEAVNIAIYRAKKQGIKDLETIKKIYYEILQEMNADADMLR